LHQTEQKYGTILKREALRNACFDESCPHLVLESGDPFPGFYCSEKHPVDISCKEKSYYLPVQSVTCCHDDFICRISLEVFDKFSLQACPAQVTLMGKYVRAVRVKNLENHFFHEVVDVFGKHGISFFNNRKITPYLGYISLKAFFEVKSIGENIFQNLLSPDIYYLIIPESIEWKLFEKLITYQKSNEGFKNFDAATGYWMSKPSFVDFLRIYGKNLSLKQLNTIREIFIHNLNLYKTNNLSI